MGDKPVVWVSLGRDKRPIVERARDLGWRVIDLAFYRGNLPSGPAPHGAFVDTLPDSPLVTDLLARGLCVIRLGRFEHAADGTLTSIIPGRADAGRLAAEHFADRKFQHVGFVCYPTLIGNPYVSPLRDVFCARARELGCEAHSLVFEDLDPRKDAEMLASETHLLRQAQLARWLQSVPKPIGIFTFSDNMAGRIAIAALDEALEIPKQVALLGYGGDRATCVSAPVLLSAVDVGHERLCDVAIRLMQDHVNGKAVPSGATYVPPSGVVIRESTDVLASTDPAVADAIRYMWDHLTADLSVDDVAAAVSTPRRKLERAFHAQIGHGINAELQRRRLERCCELLRTTTFTIADIAPMVGFRSKDYLHTLFRRRFGMTPRAYRLANADSRGNADATTS